jgi:hypothetical protein
MILKIVSSLAGIFCAYYVSKNLRMWIQAWRNFQRVSEESKIKRDQERQTDVNQNEHDKLKNIEGR